MKIADYISAGFMMMGLVLGAMTGAIAFLLIPAVIGAIISGIANLYRRKKDAISFSIPYPPYGY